MGYILLFLAVVALFTTPQLMKKRPVKRVGGTVPVPPTTTTTSKTTAVLNTLKAPLSWGLLTIYGTILGIMILMIIWGRNWISSIGGAYQMVAVTMVLLGLFLLAISKGKRFLVAIMVVSFVYLAFNKPERAAEAIAMGREEGLGAMLEQVIPNQISPIARTEGWGQYMTYDLRAGDIKTGQISAGGTNFRITTEYTCIYVTPASGLPPRLIPIGPETNPWQTINLVPHPDDTTLIFTVEARRRPATC